MASLGPGILGSTSSVTLLGNYTSIRNAMVADAAASALDNDNIAASLPTLAQFAGLLPPGFGFDGNVSVTKANLKALGFTGLDLPPSSGGFGPSDGAITFSSNFSFDFDRSDGITPNTIDFETVAAHEIGHLLGFVSAVDNVDFILPGTSNNIQLMPLDLYRFRSDSTVPPTTPALFTTTARSFVPQHSAVTSDTVLSFAMSQGINFGDGRQASHWKDDAFTNNLIGIMDPTLNFATFYNPTEADYHAFDLIGYDVPNTNAPPTI